MEDYCPERKWKIGDVCSELYPLQIKQSKCLLVELLRRSWRFSRSDWSRIVSYLAIITLKMSASRFVNVTEKVIKATEDISIQQSTKDVTTSRSVNIV